MTTKYRNDENQGYELVNAPLQAFVSETYASYSEASERLLKPNTKDTRKYRLYTFKNLFPVVDCLLRLVFFLFSPYILVFSVFLVIISAFLGIHDIMLYSQCVTITIVMMYLVHYVFYYKENFAGGINEKP